MSYDVYLMLPPESVECCCSKCGHTHMSLREQGVYSVNYTSNMSGAWDEAGAPIRDWHGRIASQVAPLLASAIRVIQADVTRFKRYEPSNGWGSVDTMLKGFLKPLLKAMKEYPDAIVKVSR